MNEDKIRLMILEYIKTIDKKKVRRRELYGRLGLKKSDYDYNEFKRIMTDLEKSGEIVRTKGRTFAPPGSEKGLVTGEFFPSRHGGGFVRPEEGDSVFVRREHTAGALPGDFVQARLIHKGHVGINRVGEIVKILRRTVKPIIGVFHRVGRTAYVSPQEAVFIEDMLVMGGEERGPREGDLVVCRAEEKAPAYTHPMCTITEVLGPPDAPGMDVLIIIKKYALPLRFPEEVITASHEIPADLTGDIISRRRDIREMVTFTIDPVDARDFDDAVSISRRKDGGFDIAVHIADVAHYVQDNSAIDLEARERGMSCYLVDRVIPMLPERLSNELCSLRPNVDRLTKSVFASLDTEGHILRHEIADTIIHSRQRLTYEQVQMFLDGHPGGAGTDILPIVGDSLRALSDLTDILSKRRMERGALDFEIPETGVILDDEGKPVKIVRRDRFKSHRMIEEAMLLANTLTALALGDAGAPFLYRIHGEPDSEKMADYADIARALGHDFQLSKASDPLYLQGYLETIKGSPHERVLNMLLLRSMKKATYSPHNIGHYGLALPVYAHFTSPIRRYPDLIVHRQIDHFIIGNGNGGKHDLAFYEELGSMVTASEIRTDAAARDSIKMKTAEFMQNHLGEEFEGAISGIIPIGFFVELDSMFVEGLVHVSTLDDDYYEVDDLGVTLIGKNKGRRFRIGDRVRIVVARTNKERGEVDFMVVEAPKKRKKEIEEKVIKKRKRPKVIVRR
jgi:ribonuclease R